MIKMEFYWENKSRYYYYSFLMFEEVAHEAVVKKLQYCRPDIGL
jgi:hypothetical protein